MTGSVHGARGLSDQAVGGNAPRDVGDYGFVVAASRLPVDQVEGPDGTAEWRPSPGGLVTALEPIMRDADGVWIGWSGAAGDPPKPFDVEGLHLVSVGLSADEVRDYYEGFCNGTLWPLYHDVIAPPVFQRPWWDAYVQVNRRYARAAAEQAAIGATVWVHDYQLQLVPGMLREQRSDVRIGIFIHIPFPGYEIFAQLPWRRQIVEGLLGADLLGFQRQGDATNFLRACRRSAGLATKGSLVRVPAPGSGDRRALVTAAGDPADARTPRHAVDGLAARSPADASAARSPADASAACSPADASAARSPADASAARSPADCSAARTAADAAAPRHAADASATGRLIRAAAFPISIDSAAFEQTASRPEVRARAQEIRQALGGPAVVLLGVDRLDYTKGILHRLNAYGELLNEGRLDPAEAVLVLVASPSRERVEQYRLLRDEVEVIVGRINGEHAELGRPPIHYLHQTYPREEMAALYLAADVMLVTSLRDGMNLVAKEYVACRQDETGALVLSEFTGAADELTSAFLVNPHDIEGLKDGIVRAATVPPSEARRRMRAMRRRVREHDVQYWAASFLGALEQAPELDQPQGADAGPRPA